MRNQLLDAHGATISFLLNPQDFCEEALAHSYDDGVAEHMIQHLYNNRAHWVEKASALWMLNLDKNGRARVRSFFADQGVDVRFLELVMKLYNELSQQRCHELGAPLAWDVFTAYRCDALAMLSYIYVNDNQEAEQCAAVVLAYL